ncbi:LOW QUALITY PROTEIN: putative F-box protein At1g70960 [Arabidopsis lyrata subsp. lyrata]|uniref:LOW QUALITY PROTEIN: putative F-box protein At1g70960 n=1 Tax=Arabidopsis lyrata subsp. lyrata TaxID=81972 RepID=UPI000A29AD16|nr:LOW QUALITY PROTEIN: putative F-box protein At1g70960 [Arabidopsis lyrata subsp. lyrata]|eukprot:XP_020865668.1 LOW QUALITY PROTEIN: putative F-box protein At1g70960 [Arabidopsis lyrata subsp. lyrata]
MTSDEESSSWRPIICKHDHAPVTEGLFKGGVLYYGAKSNSDKSVVMSFNVSSEDFSVIELPKEVELIHHWRLVNYKGDIALMHYGEYYRLTRSGVTDMWVRNEVDGNWERNSIKISHWKETFDNKEFHFKATIGTKELAFAPHPLIGEQLFVLFSDADATNFRRFEIERMVDQDHFVRTFFDHVDSTWLI